MLDDLFVEGLRSEYSEAFDQYQANNDGLLMEVNSNGPSNNYAWLGSVPRMRLFDGERKPVQVGAYKYSIENEEYEASMAIDLKDIDDDQTGQYSVLAGQIGESSAMFPDELLYGTLLPGGFSNLAYDGQYFFDTDHNVGMSGNQSNMLTGKLGPTSFNLAIDAFYNFKDDFGRPLNPALDLILIVPVALRSQGEKLVQKKTLADGSDNENYGKAELRVNPWLVNQDQWFLVNRTGRVKPFVQQNRKREELAVLGQKPGDATVINQSEAQFMRRKVYVGTYWRGAVGYGLFQKAVGSTGATGTVGA